MVESEADKTRNQLRIRFSQRVSAEQTRANTARVRTLLEELQPQLRLLTDLSDLESMDPDCASHIELAMDLCNAKGVTKVVRIIPDPRKDIGLAIMSLFHYDRSVPIVICKTLAEADQALAD